LFVLWALLQLVLEGEKIHRLIERRVEAWPAGAALELGVGRKQRLSASGTPEGAGAFLVIQGAAAGALGAVLAQDVELFRCQLSVGHDSV
jgi:hypothetical protein